MSEAIYLSDPDGLGIEVYADRPRSQWQWREGELVMATESARPRPLVAAGGGEAWTRDAGGTRIGHVHLHVGALPEAGAFYHACARARPDRAELSGRALPLRRRLPPPPGHQHLGGPTRYAAGPEDARLLEWTVIVPTLPTAEAAATRAKSAGFPVDVNRGRLEAHRSLGNGGSAHRRSTGS